LFLDNGLIFQLSPLIFTEYLNFNPLFVFHIDIGRPSKYFPYKINRAIRPAKFLMA